MAERIQTYRFNEVFQKEDAELTKRREQLFGSDEAKKLKEERFGIAMSGGGIRSATINLGILKTLNKFDILRKADYMSTVSGGGYTGAYIQTTLKEKGSFDELFHDDHIQYMRSRGEYLQPDSGFKKIWNRFVLIIGYLISLVMSWVSPLIIIMLLSGFYLFLDEILVFNQTRINSNIQQVYLYGGLILVGIFAVHFFFNILRNFNLDISLGFNRIETGLTGIGLISIIAIFLFGLQTLNSPKAENVLPYLTIAVLLIFLGFFTNPNATSFHRFYRKQLADAFLNYAGPHKNILLKDLFKENDGKNVKYLAPYPLVNTCLNLQSSKEDANFIGTKSNDYFLLSPFFCGSKLIGYVETDKTYGYNNMTFPAATTISAAAVNPGMGIYSNKILGLLTTLLNLRLGYWVPNPEKLKTTHPIVWWPFYFIYELFSMIGTNNKMVNISDGGHIENLAVYELLRRKCRLIIAVDAGEDSDFSFTDLENLTIRARNELGLDIRFREDQIPEDVLRPKPSHGYSRKRYSIADIYQLWEKKKSDEGKEIVYTNKKIGTLVYVKSSLTAPEGRPPEALKGETELTENEKLKAQTYYYKIYHPAFPHEPTSDQFFDPVQWEAYYQLGQHIAADVLGIEYLVDYDKRPGVACSIKNLIEWFDDGLSFTDLSRYIPKEEPKEEPPEEAIRTVGPRTAAVEEEVVEKEVKYKM